MKKFYLYLCVSLALISSASCTHFKNFTSSVTYTEAYKKIGEEKLYCPRDPAGVVTQCAADAFKGAPVDKFLEVARDVESARQLGLHHTKLTNYNQETLHTPQFEFAHNPYQIVSFYESTNALGQSRTSGVMVQGTPTEIIFDAKGNPAHIGFGGQKIRLLEYENRQGHDIVRVIPGQSYNQHPEGFSSPIGAVKNLPDGKKYFSELSIEQLKAALMNMTTNNVTRIEYDSGVVVEGVLHFEKAFTASEDGRNPSAIVLTFNEGTAEVTYNGRYLFRKEWGTYDMLLIDNMNTRETSLDARWPWIAYNLQGQ